MYLKSRVHNTCSQLDQVLTGTKDYKCVLTPFLALQYTPVLPPPPLSLSFLLAPLSITFFLHNTPEGSSSYIYRRLKRIKLLPSHSSRLVYLCREASALSLTHTLPPCAIQPHIPTSNGKAGCAYGRKQAGKHPTLRVHVWAQPCAGT